MNININVIKHHLRKTHDHNFSSETCICLFVCLFGHLVVSMSSPFCAFKVLSGKNKQLKKVLEHKYKPLAVNA